MRAFLLTAAMLLCPTVFAGETLGPVWPVIEIDLLELLERHAREATHASPEATRRVFESLIDKPANSNLAAARQDRNWRFDAPDGTEPFVRHWLFIDAKDEKQLAYAARHLAKEPLARVILEAGSYATASRFLNARLWTDFGGRLASKLEVRALPCLAVLTEKGASLREIALEEKLP